MRTSDSDLELRLLASPSANFELAYAEVVDLEVEDCEVGARVLVLNSRASHLQLSCRTS
jgi:hypothetical protein